MSTDLAVIGDSAMVTADRQYTCPARANYGIPFHSPSNYNVRVCQHCTRIIYTDGGGSGWYHLSPHLILEQPELDL